MSHAFPIRGCRLVLSWLVLAAATTLVASLPAQDPPKKPPAKEEEEDTPKAKQKPPTKEEEEDPVKKKKRPIPKVEEDGATTVPARLLGEFVNSLPNDRVDMKLNERQRSLNLKCGPFEANVKGIDADEFPPIPSVGNEGAISVDPKTFHDAIEQVAFAAASDDSRPVLAGVSHELRS